MQGPPNRFIPEHPPRERDLTLSVLHSTLELSVQQSEESGDPRRVQILRSLADPDEIRGFAQHLV